VTAVRVGLVGCGRLAEAGYLPALALTPRIELVAIVDPDPARRTRVDRLAADAGHPVAAHSDVNSLLAAGDLDAVVVASPVDAHVDAATAVAARGLPLLVEKPPAPDVAGAETLAVLRPAPWIGFNRRFDSGVAALRPLVPPRGHVQLSIELHYRRRSWRPVMVDDDAALDLGLHAVDLARWLTSAEAVEVAGATITPTRAEWHVLLTRARAHIALATDRPHRERVQVFDDRGRPLGKHRLGGLIAAGRGRLRRRPGVTPLVRSLAAQLDAFAGAGNADSAPVLATAADGVAAMRVLAAARASAARGGVLVPLTRSEA
jgi:myo-inositol 2-dehydrogenase/D-chiro-inositol 1-dehydrogenase